MLEDIKKILVSGSTVLIISIDEMEDIMKIVKYLLFNYFKEVCETVQNNVKEQKGGFLSMLLGTLGASLLGNMLTGKGINRAGEGIIRAVHGSKGSSISDF